MAAGTESWSEGALRKYCLYLAAGAAAVPAGIAYATLATRGLESWWTVLLVLGCGVALAHVGWTLASRRLGTTKPAVVTAAPNVRSIFFETPSSDLRDSGAGSTTQAVPIAGHWVFGTVAVLSWLLVGIFFWSKYFPR